MEFVLRFAFGGVLAFGGVALALLGIDMLDPIPNFGGPSTGAQGVVSIVIGSAIAVAGAALIGVTIADKTTP